MKSKITIIALSTVAIIAIVFSIFMIKAHGDGMSLGEYFAKLFRKDTEALDPGVAAIVNGEYIYDTQIETFLRFSPGTAKEDILEGLIMQKLLMQEAVKRGCDKKVTDEQVESTINSQKEALKQIAELPISQQPASIRSLLEAITESGTTIDEYYSDERAWNTFKNMLIATALTDEIADGETDGVKIMEKIEAFKAELRKNADVTIIND
jgi:hypothetical protein